MALPYTNGRLLSITGVGVTEDYDQPSDTVGPQQWTGSADITVRQQLLEELNGDRIDEVIQTSIKLPYAVGRYVRRGDTITYLFEGEQHTRTAGTIVRAQLTDRVRVILEDT